MGNRKQKETVTSTVINQTIDLLNQDPVRNANCLGFLKNNPISSIHSCGKSVMIVGTSDREWVFLSSDSLAELDIINTEHCLKYNNFAVVEDNFIPILSHNREVIWKMSTYRFYLPASVSITVDTTIVRPLQTGDASAIYEVATYKQYLTQEYLRERIANGPSAGIKINGRLIAWCMTHDDNAIGVLQTLPEFQGHGFARAVSAYVIQAVRNSGDLPFLHIEPSNSASLALSASMGFVKDRLVHWLGMK